MNCVYCGEPFWGFVGSPRLTVWHCVKHKSIATELLDMVLNPQQHPLVRWARSLAEPPSDRDVVAECERRGLESVATRAAVAAVRADIDAYLREYAADAAAEEAALDAEDRS